MSRQPSPELARRAAAFDRVMTALQAVADLSAEDLTIVDSTGPDGRRSGVRGAVGEARIALHNTRPADRALNAELHALDEPA